MLYEHRLNCQTRGLIAGPSLLAGDVAVCAPLIFRKREIFIDDKLSARIQPSILPWLRTYKIVVRAREGGEVIWVRPLKARDEATLVWLKLLGVDLERLDPEIPIRFPSIWNDGELEYRFVTVDQFTSVGSTTWVPSGSPTTVDYLVVAGGGAGGGAAAASATGSGGGGAGGMRVATGFTFSAKNVTVGDKGSGVSGDIGSSGGNSVFDSITSTGGGRGGGKFGSSHENGAVGGSGGGGADTLSASGTGGAGTAGQGRNGGAGDTGFEGASTAAGGGGGGSTGAGQNGTGAAIGGTGGTSTNDSTTGSSVAYAGGGGGGSVTGGVGGGAGGGTGGVTDTAGSAASIANRGSGGGGGGKAVVSNVAGGNGSIGFVALSYTAPVYYGINFPILGW